MCRSSTFTPKNLAIPKCRRNFSRRDTKQRPRTDVAEKPERSRSWIIAAAVIFVAALAMGGFLCRGVLCQSRVCDVASACNHSCMLCQCRRPVPEKSIAVLPFENLSDDKQNAFFTDGVQDEILTDLAKDRGSEGNQSFEVMQYKSWSGARPAQDRTRLGVAHLLEGSVQRVSNRVRVNAQLIDARNDAHLWAQTYYRDLADVFAIQSEIAKAIADQLQAKLSPDEKNAIEQRPTNDVAAFDLYSRAKNLMLTTAFSAIAGKQLDEAVTFLNEALQRDPSFFVAQCHLARAHDELYALGLDVLSHASRKQGRGGGSHSAMTGSGETDLVRAEHRHDGYRDYDGALKELELARQTLPNNPAISEPTGYILRWRGKSEEGLQSIERAPET